MDDATVIWTYNFTNIRALLRVIAYPILSYTIVRKICNYVEGVIKLRIPIQVVTFLIFIRHLLLLYAVDDIFPKQHIGRRKPKFTYPL